MYLNDCFQILHDVYENNVENSFNSFPYDLFCD